VLPYAGLDIPTTMQLTRYLNNIDATIIHVTHQPDILENYEHVLWLETGKLVMSAVPNQVLPAFVERMQQLGGTDALV